MISPIPIGIIVGPTACGKTAASIYIAKKLNAEIISADSIQVYKGMDIGSAKPTSAEMHGVPHHLISELDIADTRYSAAMFKEMAGNYIEDIHSRGRFPLIVGGTGLYINALTYPLDFTSVKSDDTLRKSLVDEETQSPGILYERLKIIDPISAERLHKNDLKRIVRAAEIYALTGKPLSAHGNDFDNKQNRSILYEPRIVGIAMQREMLYARINSRVDLMMEAGLLDEVKQIAKLSIDRSAPALQGLGYKQLFAYIDSEYTLDEAVERIKIETRHFAKRQLTWFKRDTRINWFNISDYGGNEELYNAMLFSLSGGDTT